MKKFKSILMLILALLPAIYTAVAVLFILPDTVAAHIGINGTPDRYGSKYEAFIFPIIIIILYIVYFLIKKFALRSSTDENTKTKLNIDIIDTTVLLIFLLLNLFCLYTLIIMNDPTSLQNSNTVFAAILGISIGIIFVIIGNIMPKTKINSFVGLRMKFCMDTDEHWYIANRSAGIALVLSGIGTANLSIILHNLSFIFYMVIMLIITIAVAILYSYVKIKRDKH